jgi:mannose-6-phosphate isomerase-like protein (cupin superfamily)
LPLSNDLDLAVSMPTVTVVDAGGAPPLEPPQGTVSVHPTLGPATGFAPLHQALLSCAPGRSQPLRVGAAEQTLFVLRGRGTVHAGGEVHPLEPEVGVYLAPDQPFELDNPGPDELRMIAVRVPDPEPGPELAGCAEPARPRATVCRLGDRVAGAATSQREFRILADPQTGLRSATHFVGYIPTTRAPDHFHLYDEVLYVLDGAGMVHADGVHTPVAPGSCIQFPARAVHCLENTGPGPMRIVAVFRPAGSPAAAYYPDGTPAGVPGGRTETS